MSSNAAIEVPANRLILGTMTFGDTVDERASAEIFNAAIETGITWIDTANVYAKGRTEEVLAPLLAGCSEELVLATKVGNPHADIGDRAPLSAEAMRLGLEGSLRRLKRDSVDILYLHRPDALTPIAETLATLAAFLAEGKIRRFAVSNYSAWQIAQIDALCDAMNIERPVVSQVVYNLLSRRIETEYASFGKAYGLRSVTYNPLAGGLLTGKVVPGELGGDRFTRSAVAAEYQARYLNDQTHAIVAELSDTAREAGMPLVELSLRWVLSTGASDAVLLGASRAEQLKQNIEAVRRGALDTELAARCSEIGQALQGVAPPYNR